MFDPATDVALLLALAAFVAGFIDSMAGGGALITVPALLLAGFSPVELLGTNKLQALFGSGSATIAYASKGLVDLRRQLPSAALSCAGSVMGALVATVLPGDLLRIALPFLLTGIAVYFAFKPNMNDLDRSHRLSPFLFGVTVVPLNRLLRWNFRAWDRLFLHAGIRLACQLRRLKATAHTKFLNFASNIGGVAAFAAAGVVSWKIGLMMGLAQFLGARLGASLAMKTGAKLIKPLLVAMC